MSVQRPGIYVPCPSSWCFTALCRAGVSLWLAWCHDCAVSLPPVAATPWHGAHSTASSHLCVCVGVVSTQRWNKRARVRQGREFKRSSFTIITLPARGYFTTQGRKWKGVHTIFWKSPAYWFKKKKESNQTQFSSSLWWNFSSVQPTYSPSP